MTIFPVYAAHIKHEYPLCDKVKKIIQQQYGCHLFHEISLSLSFSNAKKVTKTMKWIERVLMKKGVTLFLRRGSASAKIKRENVSQFPLHAAQIKAVSSSWLWHIHVKSYSSIFYSVFTSVCALTLAPAKMRCFMTSMFPYLEADMRGVNSSLFLSSSRRGSMLSWFRINSTVKFLLWMLGFISCLFWNYRRDDVN